MVLIPVLRANKLTKNGNLYELSTLIKYASSKEDFVILGNTLFKEMSEEDLLMSLIANTNEVCFYKMNEDDYHAVDIVKKDKKWVNLHEVIKGVPFENSAILYPYLFVVIANKELDVVSFHKDPVTGGTDITDYFLDNTIDETLTKMYDLLELDRTTFDWKLLVN